MRLQNIDAISLDFWDTVFTYPTDESLFHKRVGINYEILKKYHVRLEDVVRHTKDAYTHYHHVWTTEFRTPSTMELVSRMVGQLGISGIEKDEIDLLVERNIAVVLDHGPQLIEGAKEAIKKLALRFKLFLLSDTVLEPGVRIRELLAKHGLLGYFEGTFFSNELGYAKPDIRAFQTVQKATGMDSSKILHVGDREQCDILGARRAGFQTMLFHGARDHDLASTTADYRAASWNDFLAMVD